MKRLKAIIENKFPGLIACIKLVSAEEVLIENDPIKWESEINGEYASEYMKERIAKEKNGVEQIKNGTYQFR